MTSVGVCGVDRFAGCRRYYDAHRARGATTIRPSGPWQPAGRDPAWLLAPLPALRRAAGLTDGDRCRDRLSGPGGGAGEGTPLPGMPASRIDQAMVVLTGRLDQGHRTRACLPGRPWGFGC